MTTTKLPAAGVIFLIHNLLAFSRGSMSSSKTNRPWPADEPASPAGPPAVKIIPFSQSSREAS